MKRSALIFALVCFAHTVHAQITLSEQDVMSWFTSGTTLHWENAAAIPLNVGSASSTAQTFDFSSLHFGDNFNDYVTYFTLANSPGDTTWPVARDYAPIFSNAPYAKYSITAVDFGYTYYILNSIGLFQSGTVSTDFTSPGVLGFIDTLPNVPPQPMFKFPYGYDTQWVYVSKPDTSSFGEVSWDTTAVVCDAFGTLKINTGNGPVGYDCLRVKQTVAYITFDTSTKSTFRSFSASYTYVTKGGIMVNLGIDSADLGKLSLTPRAISANFNPVPLNKVQPMGNAGASILTNFPNPFSSSTVIQYSVPSSGHLTLTLYNALGKRIRTLADDEEAEGTHTVILDAHSLPRGIYFYRLTTGGLTRTGSMSCEY